MILFRQLAGFSAINVMAERHLCHTAFQRPFQNLPGTASASIQSNPECFHLILL